MYLIKIKSYSEVKVNFNSEYCYCFMTNSVTCEDTQLTPGPIIVYDVAENIFSFLI